MGFGQCLFCKNQKQLIKAHIIPRKFYESLKISRKAIRQYSENGKSKQEQSGVYDETILCKDCDGNIIGKWDGYAQELLLQEIPNQLNNVSSTSNKFNIKHFKGNDERLEIQTFKYKELKLFFMSVLWRSHLTKESFFAKVNLPQCHMQRLERFILNQDPGTEDDFSVICVKYKDTDISIKVDEKTENIDMKVIIPPTRCRPFNGLNYYQFSLCDYSFFIKVDSQNDKNMKPFILSPNPPFRMIIANYNQTRECQNVLDFITKNNPKK